MCGSGGSIAYGGLIRLARFQRRLADDNYVADRKQILDSKDAHDTFMTLAHVVIIVHTGTCHMAPTPP